MSTNDTGSNSARSVSTALDTSRREIRILAINPADDLDSILVCNLQTVALDDCTPEYRDSLRSGIAATDVKTGAQYEVYCRDCAYDVPCSKIKIPRWRFRNQRLSWYEMKRAFGMHPDMEDPTDAMSTPALTVNDPMVLVSAPWRTACVTPRYTWGDYQALSYCWESEEKVCKVVLNGCTVLIPKNLAAALRRLRRTEEVRSGLKIWCDALCVDQDNIAERNHQVSLMGNVYRGALAVVVWLGPSGDESQSAFHSMLQLHHVENAFCWNPEPRDRNNCEDWLRGIPWVAVLKLFSRTYWRRLWIVQELALNNQMTVFYCGDEQISQEALSIVAALMRDISSTITITLLAQRTSSGDSTGSSQQYSQPEIYALCDHVRVLSSDDDLEIGRYSEPSTESRLQGC
ncbi:hypothetical protein CLAFUW4_03574 [Fulvia fulva]|uniref:Heterokaryon incompatibility domain-containing protein n=1 Tax=Passalora fulva TaxID=5499 RepID=A0A9Q8L930_PASFU|nr:uncharacterized protein CLAFUR5_03554 [Fulvia fulva]KAK4631182.1 hypothetical protein CLAFUR4_03563 [Fulvia fulva]KAK4633567.1 hypothetical protein CLAFUR0_03568 [Fulvia fulva]UJO13113.1 hypothetical protein CLAFUR5_03554 [Fulvia fulva]WPV11975.1 hypothetical protein CLAFUW4_03574 [Fulvia fulva]WPV26032.1 hypothetical protein CLAFUW7_03566 [Fulvia fulva]